MFQFFQPQRDDSSASCLGLQPNSIFGAERAGSQQSLVLCLFLNRMMWLLLHGVGAPVPAWGPVPNKQLSSINVAMRFTLSWGHPWSLELAGGPCSDQGALWLLGWVLRTDEYALSQGETSRRLSIPVLSMASLTFLKFRFLIISVKNDTNVLIGSL